MDPFLNDCICILSCSSFVFDFKVNKCSKVIQSSCEVVQQATWLRIIVDKSVGNTVIREFD